jgi:hypothetical protein
MDFMPQEIFDFFDHWFNYKKMEIYCQLANQADSKPHIRSMRLYGITHTGCLEFLSHTDTQKWRDWQIHPHAAACFLNPNIGQIIVEGRIILKTRKTHPDDFHYHWNMLPQNIKKIYTETGMGNVPECFGIINMIPVLWEILEISKHEYLSNSRIIYQYLNGAWIKKKINITS